MPHPHHDRQQSRLPSQPLFHMMTFMVVAALVLYGDHVTKDLAAAVWTGKPMPLVGDRIALYLVHNPLGAFSIPLGEFTQEINAGATMVAVLLAMAVSSRLAVIDQAAPAALGLIAGGGLGNLGSMASSDVGVPDFIALSTGRGFLVMNVADIAAYVGLLCCIRMAWSLAFRLGDRAEA